MINIPKDTLTKLRDAAKKVSENAYCPYSHFPVGAAVLAENGEIYTGCNVENSSYGLTSCAERNAIFNAVAHGVKKIIAVALYTQTDSHTMPCGACRQVIYEFNNKADVFSFSSSNEMTSLPIYELLPKAFGPHNLM